MKKINSEVKALTKKVLGTINNRRGNSILAAIVISAIILIGLILLNPSIRTFIANIWTLFSNFIETKLNTLFQS